MKESNIVPLSSGFMLTSLVGFIISVFFIYQKEGQILGISFKSWGFLFALFFVMMFIAAMLSMTYAPVGHEKLVIDGKRRR